MLRAALALGALGALVGLAASSQAVEEGSSAPALRADPPPPNCPKSTPGPAVRPSAAPLPRPPLK